MTIFDRDWYRSWFYKGHHPPTCTCKDCTEQRLRRTNNLSSKNKKEGQGTNPYIVEDSAWVRRGGSYPGAPSGSPKITSNSKPETSTNLNEFITQLESKKGSRDVSILDFIIVALMIFILFISYIVFYS